jgi:ribosomal protein L29
MKKETFLGKNMIDLNKVLSEKREDLRLFRFGTSGAKTKNVKSGKKIRKDIARIMTAMNQLDKSSLLK